MQGSVGELESDYWRSDSNTEGFQGVLCPATGPRIVFALSSDSWEWQEQPLEQGGEEKKKTKTFSSPPSLENKSPLDLIFSQSFSCPFFMSSEDGEQVLGSAT